MEVAEPLRDRVARMAHRVARGCAATPASTSDTPRAHRDAGAAKRARGPQLDYKARKRAAKRARHEGNDEGRLI